MRGCSDAVIWKDTKGQTFLYKQEDRVHELSAGTVKIYIKEWSGLYTTMRCM